MIDLNLPKKQQEEEPLGMIIIGVLPFVMAFVALLEVML